jgi:CheY-like chemotaxis protein
MDASEWVSWAECPNCGGLVAVSWLDGRTVAAACAAGCLLRVEDVEITAATGVRAGAVSDVEQLASILENAVLETTEAYGLADPRLAAAMVADAWADILGEEGRSPRLVELAGATVREVGDRLHRWQSSVGRHDVRFSSAGIRVLVVGDHPLARLRLREMLAGEADVSVVGECGNGSQVVEAAARLRPHVVCLDRYMPLMARLAAAQALRAAEPDIRIVLLSGGSGAARIEIARAEADALVPMEASRDGLLRCLRTVASTGTDCPYCL